jgi:hypothetical protein
MASLEVSRDRKIRKALPATLDGVLAALSYDVPVFDLKRRLRQLERMKCTKEVYNRVTKITLWHEHPEAVWEHLEEKS